jgi:hypothetical protein
LSASAATSTLVPDIALCRMDGKRGFVKAAKSFWMNRLERSDDE